MDRSLEGRLARGLAARFPSRLGLVARAEGDGFALGVGAGDPLVTLALDRDEWTVYALDAHGHRQGFEEAMELAFALLAGRARAATERRGDALAASWFELRVEEDVYESGDVAAFLSPFEADEWTLWPGERWRVTRRAIALGQPEGTTGFERESDGPIVAGPSMLPVLERALGVLPAPLRWAVDGGSRFVYPAPRGWRRRSDVDEESRERHSMTEFAPPEPGLLFRKRCYFRDAESPSEPSGAETFRPLSVERGLPEPEGMTPGWSRHAWTLLFSDGEEEMMGIIELWFTEGTRPAATEVWRAMEPALADARYVPGRWTMHPEV